MLKKIRFELIISFLLVVSSCSKLKTLGDNLKSEKKFSNIPQKFQLAWAKNLDPIYLTGNLPIGHGTPLVRDDKVYFADQQGFFKIYDINSGRELKSFNEEKPLSGQLAIYQDRIFYSSLSGRVYCRNLKDLNLEYAIDLQSPIESVPLFHQGRLIYHLRNHQIMALDAMTGKILWSYKRSIAYSTTLQRVSVPSAMGSKLFIGFADGFVGSFNLEEGNLEWEVKITNANKFVDVDVTPIVFNSKLVVSSANGDLKFLSPETGGQIISVALTPGHTPIIDGEKLIFGTIDGKLAMVDNNGQILLEKKITEDGISSLAIWKNGIVVSSFDGNLYFLAKGNLEIIEKWYLGTEFSSVFGNLVTSGNHLAVYSSRNRLYIFK